MKVEYILKRITFTKKIDGVLQKVLLCVRFLCIASNYTTAPHALAGGYLFHADLRRLYRSIEEIESVLDTSSCCRSQNELTRTRMPTELDIVTSNPHCVFEPFLLAESDHGHHVTMWEAVIEHNALNTFKFFLEQGSSFIINDSLSRDMQDHFFEVIRNKRRFYTTLLEHIKNTTNDLEMTLDFLEVEGVVSADIRDLIKTFVLTEKQYLQSYRLADQRTLLDETVERYLELPIMQEPLVRHRRPLRFLLELDVPIYDINLIDGLRVKLKGDTRYIDRYFCSLVMSGAMLFTGLALAIDLKTMLITAPMEILLLLPIFTSHHSHIVLSRRIRAWERRNIAT